MMVLLAGRVVCGFALVRARELSPEPIVIVGEDIGKAVLLAWAALNCLLMLC